MGVHLGALRVVLVTRQRTNEHTPQAGTAIQQAMNSVKRRERLHYCIFTFTTYVLYLNSTHLP